YAVTYARKYEVEIATNIATPDDKLFPYFRNTEIPIHNLSHTIDFYSAEGLKQLDQILSRGRFSLVHCWLFPAIVQGVIISRRYGIPCIASPRNKLRALNLGQNRKWERSLIRMALEKSDVVVVPSFSAGIGYLDAGWVDPDRLRVIQNGVDCDYF